MTTVRYRGPFADHWERRPAEWAMERIARRVKAARDATWRERDDAGRVVNRTLGIGHLGGATLDDEEQYLIEKLFRGGLGMVAGSAGVPTPSTLLPGSLPMPSTTATAASPHGHESLAAYLTSEQARAGGWIHLSKYVVSLLKAWYGEQATAENEFAYALLPKISGDSSFEAMVPMMVDGTIRGLFCMGLNPAVDGERGRLVRRALGSLQWLVVRDGFETETATFWENAPEVRAGEMHPFEISTEVFVLPAAITREKAGSSTSGRLIQWHDQAVEPPGECRSEAHFVYHLGRRLKALYADEDTPAARQIRALTWEYPVSGRHEEPDAEVVLAEMNGYRVADGGQLGSSLELADDGSTACGCWHYAGVMPEVGRNRARERMAGVARGWPGVGLGVDAERDGPRLP